MATLPTKLITFISRYRTIALIVFSGMAIRLIYVLQVVDTPIFPMMATDSEYFDAMAHHLLNGQWGHPDGIFLNPFYPVFLAGIYSLCQSNPIGPIVVQAVLDSGSILLIAYIGTSLSGRRVGLMAACLYAFYGMAIFYTGPAVGSKPGNFLFACHYGFVITLSKNQDDRVAAHHRLYFRPVGLNSYEHVSFCPFFTALGGAALTYIARDYVQYPSNVFCCCWV